MANLITKIREVYPNRNWERIELECKRIIEAFQNNTPLSLIRLGDGELAYLRKSGELGNKLFHSIEQSDFVGLPDHFEHATKSHSLQWNIKLENVLQENYNYTIPQTNIISSYLFMYSPFLIGELIKGKRVLWITAGANTIVENMQFETFRNFFNLHEVVSIECIVVPDSRGPLPKIPYEGVLENCKRKIDMQNNYDIALVGGGVLGKLYCSYIKNKHRKSAVDIGCIMSAYKGVRNRLAFQKNGELGFMVWDSSTSLSAEQAGSLT